MRKTGLALLMVLALALTASAQTKISGKAHCPKAEMNSQDVGDKPGHMLMLQKETCNYTAPIEIGGVKITTEMDVVTTDMMGANGRDNGYGTLTADNGDKLYIHFSGTTKMNKDSTAAFDGKWSSMSGTGKLKGAKCSGTYKGTMAADASSDFDVEGECTMAEKPAAPAKAPAKK